MTLDATIAVLGLVLLAMLARGWPAMVETTLIAAWLWALGMVATTTAAGVLSAGGVASPATAQLLQYLAGVTTFAPWMALCGAKRPQHGPWQFVVGSLLVVLALPAAHYLVLGRTSAVSVHVALRWFMAVMVAVGATNYLGTRFWLAGLMASCGQALVVADWLPSGNWGWFEARLIAALTIWIVALISVARSHGAAANVSPFDRLWLDFRDTFGVIWALRVAERFNAAAATCNWPLALDWHGLVHYRPAPEDIAAADSPAEPVHRVDADGWRQLDAELATLALKNLQAVLWRFVSPAWIARRTPDT